MFRELQEGLLEAERIRADDGPLAGRRRARGRGDSAVCADPTRKAATYRWTSRAPGLARPTTWACRRFLGASAWLLVILEPEAGAPPDPAPNDETHHRLPDGTTLHVSIWTMPEQSSRSGFAALRLPQNEGWTQLLVGPDDAVRKLKGRS